MPRILLGRLPQPPGRTEKLPKNESRDGSFFGVKTPFQLDQVRGGKVSLRSFLRRFLFQSLTLKIVLQM